jgi:hypothetical protein
MGLDSRFILCPNIQNIFLNKDDGFPLANGEVYFYSDINRNDLKAIYKISGSPPNYSYTELPNPITLSSVGTPQDAQGNDISILLYPYDEDGNIELYFVEVWAEDGTVPQESREAWPNLAGGSITSHNIINYIPNGQFLTHNDIPATDTTIAGQIVDAVTDIAMGGWSFRRTVGTSAVDIVTFPRYGSATSNPTGNPRFAANIHTTSPDGTDDAKDLVVTFNDVNKFASEDFTYTFSFTGISNLGSAVSTQIILLKDFGTGGSTATEENIGSVEILTTSTIYNVPFIFGTNEGETIGELDDDSVSIAIRLPVDQIQSVTLTDFILTPNDVEITEFPATPDQEFLTNSVSFIRPPAADGSDFGLPLLLTKTGITFDYSTVGKIVLDPIRTAPSFGELLCSSDPNTDIYITSEYSSDGIPYSRLQSILWISSDNLPQFGTGLNYLLATPLTATGLNSLLITGNTSGSAANASDGAIATGFTFGNVTTGGTHGYQAYYFANSQNLVAVADVIGTTTSPTIGTTSFTLGSSRNDLTLSPSIFSIATTAAAALAGLCFTFSSTTTNYYIWFTVNGVGADPAPGGTGIRCNLGTNYTDAQVCNAVIGALNGAHQDAITFLAASSITPGSYFNLNTSNGDGYYIYYIIDGSGSDPMPSSRIGIPVSLDSTETDIEVATATQIAINSYAFATPPFANTFLRGYSTSSTWDYDNGFRFGVVPGVTGNMIGTQQLDNYLQHTHVQNSHAHDFTYLLPTDSIGASAGGGVTVWEALHTATAGATAAATATNQYSGGSQVNPTNSYVTYFIRY